MESSWFHDSEWSILEMDGADRKDFLHRLTTNELPPTDGSLAHNFFLSVNARIQAEFWVADLGERLLLLTPSSQVEALKECIDRYHFGEKLGLKDSDSKLYVVVGDAPEGFDAIFSPDPRHGEDSHWVVVAADLAPTFTGEEMSEQERERRRISTGRPKAGVDYDDNSLFVEVAQQDDFSETKGCYPGQEIVARVLHRGRLNKHLRGFSSDDIIPSGWHLRVDGKEVASVRSTVALAAGGSVGYLMVRREFGDDGDNLTGVDTTGQEYTLTVTARPGEVLTGEEE